MADNINDFRVFVDIVDAGSLSKAAVKLNSSTPALSRRLAALEQRLGVRLIERHARRFQVTEAGTALYQRAQDILTEIDNAEAEVASHGKHLTGRLRIGAMLQLGRHRLAPEVALFARRYPELRVEVTVSDDPMDLMEDELDILFQVEVPDKPDIIARKLTESRLLLCASPEYLDRHGRPQVPDDLLQHHCLCLQRGRRVLNSWRMRENGATREVEVRPRLVCNSGEVLYNWILDGYGIGLQFQWDIEQDLSSQRLEECLPEHSDWPFSLHAIYAYSPYPSPKVKAFLDFMEERTAGTADLSP